MTKIIKMRTNKEGDCTCDTCGEKRKNVIAMYDLMLGDKLITICDDCNETLLSKSLKASCLVQGKTKSKMDMQIMDRRRKRENDRFQ